MQYVCCDGPGVVQLVKQRLYFFILMPLVLVLVAIGCGGPPQLGDSESEGPASITLHPTSTADFGNVPTGVQSTLTITIINNSLVVPATNIINTASPSSPFSFFGGTYPGGGTCGATLAPQGTCTIVVAITPPANMAYNSSLRLSYDNGLNSVNYDLNLSAVGFTPSPALLVISNGPTYDYGQQPIGSNTDFTFTVSNTGDLPATGVTFPGIPGDFSIVSNACGASIAASTACLVTVRFSPVATGVQNQTFSINYFDGTGAQVAGRPLQGEGLLAANLVIAEGYNFDFGLLNNTFFLEQTLSITNTGVQPATSVSFTGIAAPFSVTNNTCGATIAPAGNCAITVRFAPTATGPFVSAPSLNFFDTFVNQNVVVNFAGEGFNTPLILSLILPAASPANDPNPTIRVANAVDGLGLRLYQDAGCVTEVANGTVTGTFRDFPLVVAEGTYEYHARPQDDQGNLGPCSASQVDYEYDNTAPNPVTGVTMASSFTTNSAVSPNFSWTHSTSPDRADYEIGLSLSPAGGNDVAGWTSEGLVTTSSHSGLALAECTNYYASVKVIDQVGLESLLALADIPFVFDSAVPSTPTGLASGADGTPTNGATVTWNASSDNCGIAYYEIAISEDTNANLILDPGEVGNVVAFKNIGNVTTNKEFGLVLTSATNYWTSVRPVDNTGRTGNTAVSPAWIIYDPSVELPDMIVWLDGADTSTILDNNGRDADHPSFSGTVEDWLDKSGSANVHNFNTPTATRPNYVAANDSLQFGAGINMTTGDHPELNTGDVDQRNLTVAFRSAADTATRQVVYEEGGGIRGMNIYIFNNRLYCGFYNEPNDGDGPQPHVTVSTPIAPNTVYFVTWVFDYTHYAGPAGPDGDLICYVDNTVIGATTSTSRLFAHGGDVGLGAIDNTACFEDGSCPGSGANFLGEIYEVMLFNNVPDATDVDNVHTYLSNKWD